ncbi:hypothetical protein M8J76_009422 [Diaphorina citri]|nr:hypothetical protein M8J75_003777 [Diaphorina citri]KAI5730049.1 hypothetical protein M8J76_009422 [Diaphorina citri]KAI5734986.1 hypothetical protein M8J77_012841 [Diaphorina citri]
MLLLSICLVASCLLSVALDADKLKFDTQVLHKVRQNESLIQTTGVVNDFARKVSATTRGAHVQSEEFFDPHKKGNYEDCETVMAALSISLKDRVYRRRWDDLVMLGYPTLLNAIMKTTDSSFYLKDGFDIAHTVDGQEIWKKTQQFVKSWSGVADYYRFVEMIDGVDNVFEDMSAAKMFFHNGLTKTTPESRIILPSTSNIIIPDI